MQQIFSREKWKDGGEIKPFVPVSAALSYEKVGPSLANAFSMFVVPVVGEMMADEIESIYHHPHSDEEEQQLLNLCQCAVANLAFWYSFDELSLRIGDQGFQRVESDTYKGAYKYQEDNLRATFKEKGFNALDAALDYMEKNVNIFPEFKKSQSFLLRKSEIVKGRDEVQKVYNIGHSQIVFLRLTTIFKAVEETQLCPLLGTKLYETLRENLAENNKFIGSTPTEALRQACVPYIVMKSIAYLMRSSGSITDRGLFYYDSAARASSPTSSEARKPAEGDNLRISVEQTERFAERYGEKIINFVTENLPELYGGRPSKATHRNNDGRKTFWA